MIVEQRLCDGCREELGAVWFRVDALITSPPLSTSAGPAVPREFCSSSCVTRAFQSWLRDAERRRPPMLVPVVPSCGDAA